MYKTFARSVFTLNLVWLSPLSLAGLKLSYCCVCPKFVWSEQQKHEWRRKPSYIHSSSVREVELWLFPLSWELRSIMESVVRVKKSLRMPIRKLTSCVSGMKETKSCAKRKNRRRGGCYSLGKTPPLRTAHPKDPSVIRSYQADLEKQRQVDTCSGGGRTIIYYTL